MSNDFNSNKEGKNFKFSTLSSKIKQQIKEPEFIVNCLFKFFQKIGFIDTNYFVEDLARSQNDNFKKFAKERKDLDRKNKLAEYLKKRLLDLETNYFYYPHIIFEYILSLTKKDLMNLCENLVIRFVKTYGFDKEFEPKIVKKNKRVSSVVSVDKNSKFEYMDNHLGNLDHYHKVELSNDNINPNITKPISYDYYSNLKKSLHDVENYIGSLNEGFNVNTNLNYNSFKSSIPNSQNYVQDYQDEKIKTRKEPMDSIVINDIYNDFQNTIKKSREEKLNKFIEENQKTTVFNKNNLESKIKSVKSDIESPTSIENPKEYNFMERLLDNMEYVDKKKLFLKMEREKEELKNNTYKPKINKSSSVNWIKSKPSNMNNFEKELKENEKKKSINNKKHEAQISRNPAKHFNKPLISDKDLNMLSSIGGESKKR